MKNKIQTTKCSKCGEKMHTEERQDHYGYSLWWVCNNCHQTREFFRYQLTVDCCGFNNTNLKIKEEGVMDVK